MRLGDATWPEVRSVVGTTAEGERPPILLIPIGSTEQHGPHLPLNTDTLIAEEVAERAINHTAFDPRGLIVGPTLNVTASGEHAGFQGTLSIGTEVMASVIVELVRSATWADGVVLVNGHGGNYEPVERAVELLTKERRRVLSWWPKWPRRTDGGPPDLHAGRIETSLMLAIDPGLVRLELAESGASATMEELRDRGVRAVSPTGVLGDPAGASGGEGERLIRRFVDDLAFAIERWRPL